MFDQTTILVVDDEPVIRDSVADVLRLAGFRVVTACNGLEALDILHDLTPDLIVVDIMMPHMNGYQLYHRLRRAPAWVRIPVIFLTAKGEREDVRYGRELGADDYLMKPVEPEDLIAAIEGRLERYRQLAISSQPAGRRPGGQFRLGTLVVDLSGHRLLADGDEMALSATEIGILERLILADGSVVDYDTLLGYDEEAVLDERDAASLLRYHMRNIRQKMRDLGEEGDLILNVRGAGYRLATRPDRL
ncbi:MAG: response regulator transcription factor [Anaerolineae bacterium]